MAHARTGSRLFPRRRSGTAALEFAIIGAAFTLLLLLILEGGWQMSAMAALEHGAREASRYGATGQLGPDGNRSGAILQRVLASAAGLLAANRLIIATDSSDAFATIGVAGKSAAGPGGSGQIVRYTLTYDQPVLTPLAAALLGGNVMHYQSIIMVKNEPFPGP